MASNIPTNIDWASMRSGRVKEWKKLLEKILEAARKSLAVGDSSAAETARSDLETLVSEAQGNARFRKVIDTATEVLLDIARAKGLHAARKLASLTASILVRVQPLMSSATTLSKTAARLELKPLIKNVDFAKKVLERLKSMKDAATADDPNLETFLEEVQGMIADFESR